MSHIIETLSKKYGNNMIFDFDEVIRQDIYNLFENDIISDEKKDNIGIYQFWVGMYYRTKGRNSNLMKKYFHKAFSNGISEAYNFLGLYYEKSEYNCSKSIHYYEIAISKNNINAMVNLGKSYKKYENFNKMKYYYKMAISFDSVTAMNLLAHYYFYEDYDDKMEKYYLMAIERKHTKSMVDYALSSHGYYAEYDYEKSFKYFIMALNMKDDYYDEVIKILSSFVKFHYRDLIKDNHYETIYPYIDILDLDGHIKEDFKKAYLDTLREKIQLIYPEFKKNLDAYKHMLTF